MRFKHVPEDFEVEELLTLQPRPQGPWALYRVTKRGLPTLAVQEQLAVQLRVPRAQVHFPALKDKQAVATQWASVKARAGLPLRGEGPGFVAERMGFLARPLRPQDLRGNRFCLVLRDVGESEAGRLQEAFHVLVDEGWPNYFDLQRFGSWSPHLGFPGKLLLKGDCEGALRAYLAEPLVGDPPEVLRLKTLARAHWGDWAFLKSVAPRSNLRSVLAFLVDHPSDFRRALNLVTPRVLSLWLSAYQSFLWNQMSSAYLKQVLQGQRTVSLAMPWGEVVAPAGPWPADLRTRVENLEIPLLWHRVSLPEGEVARLAEEVLAQEGLGLHDLKARVLVRAYLARGSRRLWVRPEEPRWLGQEPDDLFPGRHKARMQLTLPPGSYATLFLRILARWAGIHEVQGPGLDSLSGVEGG